MHLELDYEALIMQDSQSSLLVGNYALQSRRSEILAEQAAETLHKSSHTKISQLASNVITQSSPI